MLAAHRRMRARDDVEVELDRQLVEQLLDLRLPLGEMRDRLVRRDRLVLDRQQLQRKEFRKQHEIGAVVRRRVDEVGDELPELVEVADASLAVLHGCDPHAVDEAAVFDYGRALALVELRIAPEQMHRVAHRLLVARQVIAQHAEDLVVLPQLESEHRIAEAPVDHALHVLLGAGHLARAAVVVRDASRDNDAAQAQVAAEPPPGRVEAVTNPVAAQLRIDADLVAIQVVAIGVVRRAKAATRYFSPRVRLQCLLAAQADRRAVADDLVAEQRNEMPCRKRIDLTAQHVPRVRRHAGIDALDEVTDALDVARAGLPDHELLVLLYGLRILRFCHAITPWTSKSAATRVTKRARLPPSHRKRPGSRSPRRDAPRRMPTTPRSRSSLPSAH